jgi:hypothetical protein
MGQVVSITPRPRFTPGEMTPGTHYTGGWVGPRAGMDTEARGKILYLCLGSNPGRPVRCQTLLTELPRLKLTTSGSHICVTKLNELSSDEPMECMYACMDTRIRSDRFAATMPRLFLFAFKLY